MITFDFPFIMKQVKLADKSFQLYIDSKKINLAIDEVAKKINEDYKGKCPLFLCVLNGSFLFAADLLKRFKGECEVSFVKISSYDGTSSSGELRKLIGLNEKIEGRDVIVVEDIVDTGFTLEGVYEQLKSHKPKTIKTATLLFKPNAYQKDIEINYSALSVGNEFLVGFGLDYNGLGRNLEDIYIIKETA